MSNKSRIVAVTEQIKANNVVIGQMKTKVENLAQVTATAADVATGKVFVLPTGATANGAATLSKPEQAKTMALAMASGDQVIAPDGGKVLTAVTVTKPATLLPENIKQGVNIGGIVGTLTGAVAGAALSSIAITTPPTKLTYAAGDAFDPAGMVVTATYSNGATRVVTGCTYTPAALVVGGNVTVSFTEFGATKTAVVAVTVKAAPVYAPGYEAAGDYATVFSPVSIYEQAIIDSLGSGSVSTAPSHGCGYVISLFTLSCLGYHVDLTDDQCRAFIDAISRISNWFKGKVYTELIPLETLFTDQQYKPTFADLAVALIIPIEHANGHLTVDTANFTFSMTDKRNTANVKTGSIYELFFNAKLV